ncbi:hypothetical protein D3C79_865760 [compost metagenome]
MLNSCSITAVEATSTGPISSPGMTGLPSICGSACESALASTSKVSRSTVSRIRLYNRPNPTLDNNTRLQECPARSMAASPTVPNSTSKVLGSPKAHMAIAGKRPKAMTDEASLNPRRRSTRLPAAALNQNNSGNTALMTTTRVACTRPRMMKSANARMLIPYCLSTTRSQRPWLSV